MLYTNQATFLVANSKGEEIILGNNYFLNYFSALSARVRQIPFFGKCFEKNLLNIFSNFFFYLKVQSFRLIMENNFIQMAVSADHAVAYTIGPIFKHIIDCVQLYFTNGSRIVSFCLWLVGITLIFDGTPQIILQRFQIAAPRWPNDISYAADNAIFKNRAQNIDYSFGCVARSTVLLKPNVANILIFNFCEKKFVQHDPITIAIDCNGLSLLIF